MKVTKIGQTENESTYNVEIHGENGNEVMEVVCFRGTNKENKKECMIKEINDRKRGVSAYFSYDWDFGPVTGGPNPETYGIPDYLMDYLDDPNIDERIGNYDPYYDIERIGAFRDAQSAYDAEHGSVYEMYILENVQIKNGDNPEITIDVRPPSNGSEIPDFESNDYMLDGKIIENIKKMFKFALNVQKKVNIIEKQADGPGGGNVGNTFYDYSK